MTSQQKCRAQADAKVKGVSCTCPFPKRSPDHAPVAAHDSWAEAYNRQSHWAHREREDARRASLEVLGWVNGRRHEPEKLAQAFFSTRFARTLDSCAGTLDFATGWFYGQEGLAKREAALWVE